MHKVSTGKVRFLDSADIYFISCEVGCRLTQPSSIHLNSQPYHSDTHLFRLIPYDLYFKEIH